MAMRLLYGLFAAATCSAVVNAITYTQSHKVAEGQTDYSFSWATSGENAARKFHLRLEFDTDAVGWIGWGLGEAGSGGMAGADIVICTKETAAGDWKVDDRYKLDSCRLLVWYTCVASPPLLKRSPVYFTRTGAAT